MSTETLHLPNKWKTWNHKSIMNTLKYLFNNLCKTEEQRELCQKLNELRIKKNEVRIKEDVLKKERIEYLNEIIALLRIEWEFNQRIESKMKDLNHNTPIYEEFYEIKEYSNWEILSLKKNFDYLIDQYLSRENDKKLKIDVDFIVNLMLSEKNIWMDLGDTCLNGDRKGPVYWKLIQLGEFDFIIDNIDFLYNNGFLERFKNNREPYRDIINEIINNWWWESVCLRFRDFKKISYEDYKIIVDKLREQKVSIQNIRIFISAYSDLKKTYGDWWFNEP